MSDKTDFQVRVLKKYGVIPVFEGTPGYSKVRTSLPGETYKQWCARVIGKKNDEVSLYCMYQPKGNARIGRLGRDGDHLKKIVQVQSRKSFVKGLNQSRTDAKHDDLDVRTPILSRLVSRDELYDALADAVPERSEAIDEFFKRFADQHAGAEGWSEVFEKLAREYANLATYIKI